MRITKKGIIGTAATIMIIVLAGGVIGYYLVTRSFSKISGTIRVKGLTHEVKVYRDEYGVPHISAQSEYDAFFAVGYTHAQDRLWQMDLMRRAGSGRLSEVLGEPALKIDKMFRTLGLEARAETFSVH